MTTYDQAMQECMLEYRPVTVIIFKVGILIVLVPYAG